VRLTKHLVTLAILAILATMDPRFLPHNTHLIDAKRFAETDPQLAHLASRPLRHQSSLLDELPSGVPGIYSLSGGRQIGKSTLLKQWMAKLLHQGVKPEAISYFSGELIDDHHSLVMHLENQLETGADNGVQFIILDEVTYVRDWDKAIKFAADAGLLAHAAFMITGSDLAFLQDARMRFPGRRGQAQRVDFHLHPLSFREFLQLDNKLGQLDTYLEELSRMPENLIESVYEAFSRYLLHGGYLTAINDLAEAHTIRRSTFATYSDWIRGDMLKRGKSETYLREVLGAIVKRYGTQVTWNALSRDLSVDHPRTIADYVALLERMDAVTVLPALLEHKLVAAPKKARKVVFSDSFILHAVRAWLTPVDDPFSQHVQSALADPLWVSKLVEASVACNLRRFHPTFYIKGQGEVDIAYVRDDQFCPIEIKWGNQLRPKSIKQIARYGNGEIWRRQRSVGEVAGIRALPLPVQLLRVGTEFM